MKNLLLSLVVVFGLMMAFAAGCAPTAIAENSSPPSQAVVSVASLDDLQELERFLDAAITERMETYHIPSHVVAVVWDGQVVFAKGYGYADPEKRVPVDPERTLFRICSVSKLFVWTAVMQLVERGKLDLHVDVNTYLAELSEQPAIRIPDTYPEPITLAHLLTHTSGLEKQDFYDLSFDQERWIPLEQYLATHMPERVYPPGQFWIYSNYGTSLAAYIVQRVSGMPFEEYVERFIYEPLEMEHSTFRQPLPPALSGDLATGFIWQTSKSQGLPSKFEWLHPAGSMTSTATDMAKFMIAHLQNGRWGDKQILAAQTAVDMHAQHFSYDQRLPGFAYGFFEENINGTRLIHHAGGSAAFSAHVALVPEQNLGIFEAYSGGEAGSGFVYTSFMEHFFSANPAAGGSPSASILVRKFAGEYLDLNVNRSSPEKLLALVKGTRVKETGDGALAFLGGRWIPVAPLTFREVNSGDLAVFRTDDGTPEDRVTYLIHGELAYERLPWYRRTGVHLALLAGCLLIFLSVALGWPVVSLLRRRRPERPTPWAQLARWVSWGTSMIFLIFVLAFALEAWEKEVLLCGLTPGIKAILILPLLGAALATATMILAVAAWKGWNTPTGRPYWSLGSRVHYTLVALAGAGFVWWLAYWNLLGFW